MQSLVQAVCPHFPEDRNVSSTRDSMTWYKFNANTKTLYVPPTNILKVNPVELDRYIEAVNAFAIADLSSPEYDWDNLNLHEVSGSDMLDVIYQIKAFCKGRKVACDIETRRVEWEDNKLLSIGIAVDENTCWAFHDLALKGASGHATHGHSQELWRAFQDLFESPDIRFIWHNGKFDCGRLMYLCGFKARVDEDTMLKHYACINEKRGTHGLKDLGQLYLQAPAWEDELDGIKKEWCRSNKKNLSDFMYDDIPTSVLIPYMQRDCIATYRLDNKFDNLKRPGSDFIYRKLIQASEAYMQIELAGMRLDMDYLEDLEWELEKEEKTAKARLDAVSKQIWDPYKYAKDSGAKSLPSEFNVKSPKQLKWMLQQVLGYPVPSTDAPMMENLLSDVELGVITNPLAKEFIESIGIMRKNSKYMDTYVQGLRNVVCSDGRIRCTFNLHGTETGRLSSSNPNMQNIPRNKLIKNLIVATPGYRLLQLDYSQAELRVLAMLSDDPFMIQIYRDGKDLHDAVATDMFGPDFDKEQRNLAKTINFGIAYGRGPSSIAEKFKKSMAESRDIIAKWFKPMPKVKEYIDNQRKKPLNGEPCTTLMGRERHFVITNEDLNHIQNEYINTPIQSLASDLTMFSLLHIHDMLQEMQVDARIITSVHDSIILEVRDDPELINLLAVRCKQIMADTPLEYIPDCKVPFKADADAGYKWGEMEKWAITD